MVSSCGVLVRSGGWVFCGEAQKAGLPPELGAGVSFYRSLEVLVPGSRAGKAGRVPAGWGSGEGLGWLNHPLPSQSPSGLVGPSLQSCVLSLG